MSQCAESTKKYTGIYRCPDEITYLTISVQIKEIVNEVPLSKPETRDLESRTFRWQEKVYGKSEREFYKDEKNCVTDLDKKYHNDVVNMLENENVLYSYVDEDEFSLQEEKVCNSANVSTLCKKMNDLRFVEDVDGAEGNYDFIEHLCNSVKNPYYENNFLCMYVMADFGVFRKVVSKPQSFSEYVDNTWLKSEYILCTLKYNKKRKLLFVFPDFTKYEAYPLQINGDLTKKYQYTIENLSESINPEVFAQEGEVLNKITAHQLKLKSQAVGQSFDIPQRDKLVVHLFVDILTAKNFEYNDIYVQYSIDLPEHWHCSDQGSLKGVTYSSHTKDENNLAYFGFPFEIALEYDIQHLEDIGVPQSPYVYFEVVSKDTWNRYRTEGLTYKVLPVSQPGTYRYELQCLRILPNKLAGNMRRFFIGDYMNYSDITWIAIPKNHEGTVINKHGVNTIGTGQIDVKVNVIHQSQAFMNSGGDASSKNRERTILEKLNSSTLVKSVEQVLEAFKRARQNMIEARKRV